jgi:hypothetical protein
MKITVRRVALGIASAGLLTIYGCGGGSSSAIPNTNASDVTTTFSGVAATGAALAGATVNITCASGSGAATTTSSGSYSVDIKNISLPCALKAASSDGITVLYSVTSATATSTNTQVANITPLTQLLVASLAGIEPATFFNNFSASTASGVTDSAISTAQTAVLTVLSNAGIDVSGLSTNSLVSGSLVPGSTANPYDVTLEALSTKLTSTGTTLATLTTTVANSTSTTTGVPTSPTTTTPNVASLPAALLLKTADSNCSALRSGDYWVINPIHGSTITNQYRSGSYSASSKTATSLVGDSTVFSDAGTCHYLAGDGVSDIVVSQAGVVVARYKDAGNVFRLAFAIPKQTIAVSELAGTWNALAFQTTSTRTSYVGKMWTATVGSAGVVSDAIGCDGTSTTAACSAVGANELPTFSSNSDGGFNSRSAAWPNDPSRSFAYRAGNGDLMLVMVDGDGSVSTWTKKRTLSLPAVNTIQPPGWSLRTLSTLIANALSVDTTTTTITAVDTTLQSYTRTISLPNGTADYSETILLNTPLAGFNFRAAGSITSTFDSRPVNIRERTSLGLRGMGVSVQSVPVQSGISSAGFQISIDQP